MRSSYMFRVLRLLGFLGVTVWLGLCLLRLAILKKPERLKAASLLMHHWGRRVLKVFSIRVFRKDIRVFDDEAGDGKIYIANHVSYLDIAVMLSEGPCLFLAKKEVSSWPLLGVLAQACGIVFVDRDKISDRAQALRRLRALVNQGHRVVVFPEGTTSLIGPRKGWVHFFPGVFGLARRTGSSVEMRYIEYQDEEVCAWVGDDSFLGHLWRFSATTHSRVYVRQNRLMDVKTRFDQTRVYAGARRWYLDGGRSLTYFL